MDFSGTRTPRAGALVLSVFAVVLLTATASLANPLPPGLIFTHVQLPDPGFCDHPLTACSQIVQHTSSEGPLEFDLFLYPAFVPGPVEVSRLETAVEWPSEWTLFGYEICDGGQGSVDILSDGAILDVEWPACRTMTEEVFLAVRFVFDATLPGVFRARSGHSSQVVFGCPPVDSLDMYVSSAEAGVECAWCDQPCDLSWACRPDPDSTSLTLEVIEGGSAATTIHVPITGGDLMNPCEIDFVGTESWMQIAATELGWQDWSLTLEVQTAGLATGWHEGWIRMESECLGCTHVALHVLPEGTPVSAGTAASTWGRVKALYR